MRQTVPHLQGLETKKTIFKGHSLKINPFQRQKGYFCPSFHLKDSTLLKNLIYCQILGSPIPWLPSLEQQRVEAHQLHPDQLLASHWRGYRSLVVFENQNAR